MDVSLVVKPKRMFKIGSTILNDPAPNLPPNEALMLYATAYPHLKTAELEEPELIDDELQYKIKIEPIKTKG